MSAFHLTLVSLLLVCLALTVVAFANHQHQQQLARRHRSLAFRRRLAELEEMVLAVEPVVESAAIARILNDENLALVRQALQLEPESEALAAHLHRAEELARELADDHRPRQLCRLLENDAAIVRTRYYLMEASRILRRRALQEETTSDEAELYVAQLMWAHLMVQVISMIGQGHKATNNDNGLMAFAYYRKAQQALIDSMIEDQRRQEMIRQLADVMSGKRRALSQDLMPETFHNPNSNPTPSAGKNPAATARSA